MEGEKPIEFLVKSLSIEREDYRYEKANGMGY
jgi:hypothetical protein